MKLEGLEVWYRPGQGPRFFVRYGFFLFLVNLAANVVYLAAWQLAEGVGVGKIALGAAFALGGSGAVRPAGAAGSYPELDGGERSVASSQKVYCARHFTFGGGGRCAVR